MTAEDYFLAIWLLGFAGLMAALAIWLLGFAGLMAALVYYSGGL